MSESLFAPLFRIVITYIEANTKTVCLRRVYTVMVLCGGGATGRVRLDDPVLIPGDKRRVNSSSTYLLSDSLILVV